MLQAVASRLNTMMAFNHCLLRWRWACPVDLGGKEHMHHIEVFLPANISMAGHGLAMCKRTPEWEGLTTHRWAQNKSSSLTVVYCQVGKKYGEVRQHHGCLTFRMGYSLGRLGAAQSQMWSSPSGPEEASRCVEVALRLKSKPRDACTFHNGVKAASAQTCKSQAM